MAAMRAYGGIYMEPGIKSNSLSIPVATNTREEEVEAFNQMAKETLLD